MHNQGLVTEHVPEEEVIHNHLNSAMERGEPRIHDFNWDAIHFDDPDLRSLGEPFTEEEVQNAINRKPRGKAPGPDGFTGIFFKKCWDIIKLEVMNVIHLFGSLHAENFHWLNSANIFLLPKKEGRSKSPTLGP
jgi:hypothetical protein